MIGPTALLPKLFFLLVGAAVACGLYFEWRNARRQGHVGAKLLFVSVFLLVWSGLVADHFIREGRFRYQMQHLRANHVQRIDVGKTSLADPAQIAAVVRVLQRPQWFSVNHGGWADEVPLTITLLSGERREYRVGLYLRGTGAVVTSMSHYDGDGRGSGWSNGEVFYHDLPAVLAQAGIRLPNCQTLQTERPCSAK